MLRRELHRLARRDLWSALERESEPVRERLIAQVNDIVGRNMSQLLGDRLPTAHPPLERSPDASVERSRVQQLRRTKTQVDQELSTSSPTLTSGHAAPQQAQFSTLESNPAVCHTLPEPNENNAIADLLDHSIHQQAGQTIASDGIWEPPSSGPIHDLLGDWFQLIDLQPNTLGQADLSYFEVATRSPAAGGSNSVPGTVWS
jgi:hypothetical protein